MNQIPTLTVSVPEGTQDPTARTKVCITTSSIRHAYSSWLITYLFNNGCMYVHNCSVQPCLSEWRYLP